jgi:hypothetical protein
MGIFSFLFSGRIKRKSEPSQAIEPQESDCLDGSQYIDMARKNDDICDGVVFHATHQLRTPVEVLKKDGEVYRGDGEPPNYGEMRDGIWLMNIDPKYQLCEPDEEIPASDAMGSVNSKDYLDYAIALLSIFERNELSIHDKMALAGEVSGNNPIRKNVESSILKFYRGGEGDEFSIEDVMSRFISKEESLNYFKNKKTYLRLVDGTNIAIINTLIENGIATIEQLYNTDDKLLLKLKGIGKVSLTKMRACLSLIRH